jgi:hypothetical protein
LEKTRSKLPDHRPENCTSPSHRRSTHQGSRAVSGPCTHVLDPGPNASGLDGSEEKGQKYVGRIVQIEFDCAACKETCMCRGEEQPEQSQAISPQPHIRISHSLHSDLAWCIRPVVFYATSSRPSLPAQKPTPSPQSKVGSQQPGPSFRQRMSSSSQSARTRISSAPAQIEVLIITFLSGMCICTYQVSPERDKGFGRCS